jgi:formate hydrogenlyase subunit 3/multisubunit Na+/H+ antiporter MnhD subunit
MVHEFLPWNGGYLLLPVMFPLVGAALALAAAIWRLRRTGWFFALAGVAAGLLALGWIVLAALNSAAFPMTLVVGGWSPVTGIVVSLDRSAAILGLVVYAIAFLVLLYAYAERDLDAIFAGVYAIAVAGMAGVIISGDLFNLFVFFEILSLCAVILIACHRRGPAVYAALRYLVVASISIAFYLLGLLLIYRVTGELAIDRVVAAVEAGRGSWSAGEHRNVVLGVSAVMGAVATRVAVVPFHGWLPAAHGQAPTPVSAFLSGLMLKSGFLALWRVSAIAHVAAPALMETLLVLGGVSAVVGALMAFTQNDVKRLLAFSSISQMGFLVTALAAGAFAGALFHAAAHAVFKSLLFLLVGCAVSRNHTHDLDRLRRVRSTHGVPILEIAVFLIAFAGITGVPGLSGFAGKELIGEGVYLAPRETAGFGYRALKIAAAGTVATFLKLSLIYLPLPGWRRSGGGVTEGSTLGSGLSAPEITPGGHPSDALSSLRPTEAIARGLPLAVLALAVPAQGLLRTDLIRSSSLYETGIVFAGGAALFLLAGMSPGRRMIDRIGTVRWGMDAAVAMVLVGLVVLMV